MIYHAVVLNNTATIRQADHGLTDAEFTIGCRIKIVGETSSRLAVVQKALDAGYEVVDEDTWKDFIRDPQESDNIQNDRYILSSVSYDKWESKRVVY